MDAPQTVKQLNAAIVNSFHILEGTRSYETFTFCLTGDDQEIEVTRHVLMLTLSLKGPEDLCCEQIWDAIAGVDFDTNRTRLGISYEIMRDRNALLFVRRWFEYEDMQIRGRIGFYEPRYQKGLKEHRVCKAEGQPMKKVLREKE